MHGILNIHKTTGMTSFDVVAKIRRLFNTKKVGHAGTLDPDAGGVLPVCVGKATKVIEYMMEKDKAYRVGLMLGAATDTQDASGHVLYENKVESSFESIEHTIKSFVGPMEQIPPMYSAIKVDGKKLYELARQGVEIERKPRPVTFYGIDILSMENVGDKVRVIMDVNCSKGTYMRTLCHDIGEKLGCGGHMESLVRTRSGPFLLKDAYTLESLNELKAKNRLEEALLPMDQALVQLDAVHVNDEEAKRLLNGLTIGLSDYKTEYVRIYGLERQFLAIGKAVADQNGAKGLKTHKWIGNEL
ncbi:MAG: tRNA pseudouridine(55) synthase TruB [Clostridia bacterium]|nr:tRNA pseudouridine(55) synthase TruB [Clostridia bacterium]